MPRAINIERDLAVLNYLDNHTWSETAAHFEISEMTISRIQKRNPNVSVSDNVSVSENKVSVSKNKVSVSDSIPIKNKDSLSAIKNSNNVSVSDNVSVIKNKVSVSDSIPIKKKDSLSAVKNSNNVSVSDSGPFDFEVPDYNDIMSFAKRFMDQDIECEQFFRHGSTRYLYKQHFNKERGGGGWSGSIKATINILNKMKKRGAL